MENTKTTLIAELANAHQGSVELAEKITVDAKKNGAENIKYQVYTADELLNKKHNRYDHFKNQQFNREEWEKIFDVAKGQDLNIYCDVFGEESLDTVIGKGIRSIKIHTSDMLNKLLIKKINLYEWDNVLISTGGATGYEIIETVNMLENIDKKRIVLMHGFQSYPTQHSDANLERINWLKYNCNEVKIGYQDHSAGDSKDAILLPQLAIAMGASVIEKHITMNRSDKGVDWFSSINTSEFNSFKQQIKRAEDSIGKIDFEFSESETRYRKSTRKQWYYKDNIKQNEVIDEGSLIMLRKDNSQYDSLDLENVIGKKVNSDVYEDEEVLNSQLENNTVAAIIVRTASNRLPGKALLKIGSTTCIKHLINRVKLARKVSNIIVCTTNEESDDYLVNHLSNMNIHVSRGDSKDIVTRVINGISEVGNFEWTR